MLGGEQHQQRRICSHVCRKLTDLGSELGLRVLTATEAGEDVAACEMKILMLARRIFFDGTIQIRERGVEIPALFFTLREQHQGVRRIVRRRQRQLRLLLGPLLIASPHPDARQDVVRLAGLDLHGDLRVLLRSLEIAEGERVVGDVVEKLDRAGRVPQSFLRRFHRLALLPHFVQDLAFQIPKIGDL